MKKINLQLVLRIIAVLIILVGLGIGYDCSNNMLLVDNEVQYIFDWTRAFIIWLAGCSLGVLFLALAKILDLLEGK